LGPALVAPLDVASLLSLLWDMDKFQYFIQVRHFENYVKVVYKRIAQLSNEFLAAPKTEKM
jgi:hypothetical protein